MDSFNMLLPGFGTTKILPAVITLEGFDLIVSCHDMPGELSLRGKLDTTCKTLEVLLLEMDSLEVFLHIPLFSKPSPAFFALVIYTIMGSLVLSETGQMLECLVATFNWTRISLNFGMDGSVRSE